MVGDELARLVNEGKLTDLEALAWMAGDERAIRKVQRIWDQEKDARDERDEQAFGGDGF